MARARKRQKWLAAVFSFILSVFPFCLLSYFPPTGLMPVSFSSSSCCCCGLSVQQQLSSSCCFARATASVPLQHVYVCLQHVWCSSGHCSLSCPSRSFGITFFRTPPPPVICFALFLYFFCFSVTFALFS